MCFEYLTLSFPVLLRRQVNCSICWFGLVYLSHFNLQDAFLDVPLGIHFDSQIRPHTVGPVLIAKLFAAWSIILKKTKTRYLQRFNKLCSRRIYCWQWNSCTHDKICFIILVFWFQAYTILSTQAQSLNKIVLQILLRFRLPPPPPHTQ